MWVDFLTNQTYMLGGLEPSLHRTELFSAKGCFNLRTTPSYAGILNNDQTIGKAFIGQARNITNNLIITSLFCIT